MTGPGTDWSLFEHDDEENGTDDDDQDQDDCDDYGADDDWPADICHPLYDGR